MTTRHRTLPFVALALAGVVASTCADGPPEPLPLDAAVHKDSVDAWFARRYAELEAPDSWLALIGLHWLESGRSYTLGSDSTVDIVLPEAAAPRVGRLEVTTDAVRFVTEPEVRVTRGIDSTLALPAGTGARPPDTVGLPVVEEAVLTEEVGEGKSVVLRHGSLNWIIHSFGDQVALRVRDNRDPTYADFEEHPIERDPVDPAWRLTARWVSQEKTVAVPNVVGTVSETTSPAYLEFWVDGERHTLDVPGGPDHGRYMLVFADSTSGRTTYGGGRYLWVDSPDEEGRVVLDFNLAYNPPCVFSAFATCPLPTRENRLALPVTAGERAWEKAERPEP